MQTDQERSLCRLTHVEAGEDRSRGSLYTMAHVEAGASRSREEFV